MPNKSECLARLAGFEIDIAQIALDLEVAREVSNTLRIFELTEELADYHSEKAKHLAEVARLDGRKWYAFFR